MKITNEDYKEVERAINEVDIPPGMHQDYTERGRSDTWYYWDVFYMIPPPIRGPLINRLYTYLNDIHIETALRKILNSQTTGCIL